ncbi:hypothetical protein [Nocardioides montaniterrae]
MLSAAEIIQVARESADEPLDVSLARALRIVDDLITRGLAVAGDAAADFVPWDSTPPVSSVRIADEWRRRDDPFVAPGEIVWLDLTDAGEEAARAVLAREQED